MSKLLLDFGSYLSIINATSSAIYKISYHTDSTIKWWICFS